MPAAGRVASRNAWPNASRRAASSPWMDRRPWSTARADGWRGSAIASSTSSRTSAGRSRSRDLSTRSSRPRPSTGCPTTTRCSGTSPPSRSRAVGLVAQCGGAGNIASVLRVLATIGDGWLGPVHFETPGDTERRLAAAGYEDIACWLSEETERFEAGEPFEAYLRTVVLGAHLERLPATEHDAFVRDGRRRPRTARDRLCPLEHHGAARLIPLSWIVGVAPDASNVPVTSTQPHIAWARPGSLVRSRPATTSAGISPAMVTAAAAALGRI